MFYIILFTLRCTERYEQTQPCFKIYSIILLEFKSCSAFQLDAHFEAADESNREMKYIPGDAFIIKCIDGFDLTSGEKFTVLKCTGDEDWVPSVTQLPTCVQQVLTTQMYKLYNAIMQLLREFLISHGTSPGGSPHHPTPKKQKPAANLSCSPRMKFDVLVR